MKLDFVKKLIGDRYASLEDSIRKELFSEECSSIGNLNEYVISNLGKKVRPVVTLLAALACDKEINEEANICSLVSEIMHNATLLHDDVIDQSDMRRGAVTINKLKSPGASILLGDYWLSRAVMLLIDNKLDSRIISLFALTIKDLSEGELLQMEKAELLNATIDDYYSIIFKKTGQLFRASIMSSAISVGATEEYIAALEQYAIQIGYAFQIKDDILDYSNSASVGKGRYCDIEERKITLPMFMVFKDAELKAKVLDLLDSAQVEEIAAIIVDNGGIEASEIVLDKHINMAIDALEILPQTEAKNLLKELALYIGRRDS